MELTDYTKELTAILSPLYLMPGTTFRHIRDTQALDVRYMVRRKVETKFSAFMGRMSSKKIGLSVGGRAFIIVAAKPCPRVTKTSRASVICMILADWGAFDTSCSIDRVTIEGMSFSCIELPKYKYVQKAIDDAMPSWR